jgi:hypothetical protein
VSGTLVEHYFQASSSRDDKGHRHCHRGPSPRKNKAQSRKPNHRSSSRLRHHDSARSRSPSASSQFRSILPQHDISDLNRSDHHDRRCSKHYRAPVGEARSGSESPPRKSSGSCALSGSRSGSHRRSRSKQRAQLTVGSDSRSPREFSRSRSRPRPTQHLVVDSGSSQPPCGSSRSHSCQCQHQDRTFTNSDVDSPPLYHSGSRASSHYHHKTNKKRSRM